MKIVHIEETKRVKKTKKELEKEQDACVNEMSKMLISEYKFIPRDKPIYIVEMTMEELQLVSFYLELEKLKPIIDINIKKENKQ